MLLHLLIASTVVVGSLATPSPNYPPLIKKDVLPTTCNRDNLFRCLTASPVPASPYCASVLGTVTVTAATVTPLTSATSTIFVTVTATSTTTTSTTQTSTVTSLSTEIDTVTSISTFLTTTTVTNTVGSLLNKRDVASAAGPKGPPCLTNGVTYPASRITSACSCLYTRSTVTFTPSAATATIVSSSTVFPVVTVTVTTTSTVAASVTTTIITTTDVTTTTVTTQLATSQATPIEVDFTRVVGPDDRRCVYNEYYDYREVPDNSPGPNNDYRAGVFACRDRCATDSNCKFFFFLKFDPNLARGYGGANCILDNVPYQPQFLQCGYVDNYYVAYNKVIA